MADTDERLEVGLAGMAENLSNLGVPFSLVGGLAVSIRGEVRFTRDVDLAVSVSSDEQMEALVRIEHVGSILVAEAEELLAMKVLSMTERRPQDRIDARALLLANPTLDVERVRTRLELIRTRGYERGQDLLEKLESVVRDARTE